MPASVRDPLQASLGAAYTLGRELGGGGMSRVYVAHEAALGRDVVVKVLAPELAEGLSAERFAREIRLAAGLQEPHIVPVLAAGVTADGLPWYTMPYVRGESLRARLAAGPMPLAEGVSVLRDVARALAYAHRQGVVHRDVKPENVLLSEGTAVVTDYGIAKALAAAKTQAPDGPPNGPASSTLTQRGTSLGTPAYMAPEQAAGDPATDHRADLYAWGVVAYELLAGRHPFVGRTTPQQLMAAHFAEVPAPLPTPPVPPALAALVARCLAKDPVDRPASAADVLAALDGVSTAATPAPSPSTVPSAPAAARRRWLLGAGGAVVVVALLAAGVAASRGRLGGAFGGTATAVAGPPSLAVLPFENQGDSTDAYFADGITDAVRGKLTALPGSSLAVIARASSVSYRGTAKAPAAIAGELGVRYLLTGTVRFAGAGAARRVQVSPELVEVVAGRAPQSRWAQPFDAEVRDVFAVQADIAGRVASAMQVALGSAAQAQLAEAPTRDPAAYDAFLRGEAIRNAGQVDPRSLRRLVAAYGEAVGHDSTMALAWAGLSGASSLLYQNSTPTPARARTARTGAERAVALDATRPEGYVALANYHHMVTRDLGQALAALARARALAPQDASVRSTAAVLEGDLGQMEAARRDLAEAVRLDPRNATSWGFQAELLLRLGRVGEARASAERTVALAPTSLYAILLRALVEAAAGDVPAARRVLARAARDVPREALVADVARYFDVGWLLDAEQERLLLALGPDAFDDDPGTLAIVRAQQYGWRGDAALARAWGDSAARAFAGQLRAVPTDPQRHVLRGLALAYAGRGPEALAEAARGLALQAPMAEGRGSLSYGYFTYVSARTALLAGDRDRALAWLAESRRAHYFAGPGWLRTEPTWAPLRGDPRFERLVASAPR